MNQPLPGSHYILQPNEKKLEFKEATQLTNAGSITLMKEDHTVGNLIRM
jgi:DNA-directed RNA polymerase subunit L